MERLTPVISPEMAVGAAFSAGGFEATLQGFGFLDAVRAAGFPALSRIAAASGGCFPALAATHVDLYEPIRSIMLDERFQPGTIVGLKPWDETGFDGPFNYVLAKALREEFGVDVIELAEIACSVADTRPLMIVTTPMRRVSQSEYGFGARPHETHFDSRLTPPEVLADAILASCAQPPLYPHLISGEPHTDGGFSRWYPLGIACRDVDLAVGFCLKPNIEPFSQQRLSHALLDVLDSKVRRYRIHHIPKLNRFHKWLERIIEDARQNAAENLPATVLDVFIRLAEMHIEREIESEETWAERRESLLEDFASYRDQMYALAQGYIKPRRREAFRADLDRLHNDIVGSIPLIGSTAPHISVFSDVSAHDLNRGQFSKDVVWTQEQKLAVIEHGRQRTEEKFRQRDMA